jgi:hypothetical protein
MWATLLIGMSSITVPPLEVSFAPVQSITPLVLPFALIYGAFHILLGRAAPLYFKRRGGESNSMTMKSQLSAASLKGVAGSHKKRNHHASSFFNRLRDAVQMHVLGAASLVTIALVALHWSLYSGLVIAANMTYNVGIIIIGMVIGFILCGLATHLFFHFRTSQFRLVSAFIMAGKSEWRSLSLLS